MKHVPLPPIPLQTKRPEMSEEGIRVHVENNRTKHEQLYIFGMIVALGNDIEQTS